MKLFSTIGFFIVLAAAIGLFFTELANYPESTFTLTNPETTPVVPIAEEPEKALVEEKAVPIETPRPIGLVPFTSQAPSAQWSDSVFQNACEEASILMAHLWKTGAELPAKSDVEKEIRALSALARERFGEDAYDTSAEDTAGLYREYFNDQEVSVIRDATILALKESLAQGSVVIAPFDGRKLANPHYTPPGPEYHMLIIIGYDPETKAFITNDPGTRYGAGYRYDENVLYEALRDYRTGYHLPVPIVPEKTAIVLSRNR